MSLPSVKHRPCTKEWSCSATGPVRTCPEKAMNMPVSFKTTGVNGPCASLGWSQACVAARLSWASCWDSILRQFMFWKSGHVPLWVTALPSQLEPWQSNKCLRMLGAQSQARVTQRSGTADAERPQPGRSAYKAQLVHRPVFLQHARVLADQ